MVSYLKTAGICLAGLLLAGCAGPLNSSVSLREQLGADEALVEQYTRNNDWWTIYDDPQLNGLVELALQNNIDLAKSLNSVQKAWFQARLAGADLIPEFSGDLGASASKNIKDGGPSSRSFSGELAVQYEIDLWRRIGDSVDSREWEHKATIEDLAAARMSLVNSVVSTYFYLSYLDGAIRATQEQVERYQGIERIIRNKYELGKSDGLELAQAEQSVLGSESSLLDLQSERKEYEQTLRDLLNLRPSDELDLHLPDMLQVATPGVNLEVPLSVLAARPDLQASEYRLRSAFSTVKATRKNLYPSLTVGASLSSSSEKAKTMFDVPFTGGSVKINLPFLQWNSLRWEIRVSEAEYEEARLDFEQSLTTALNEVDSYYYLYEKSRQSFRTSGKKNEADARISQYYKDRYEMGANELSDWLNALGTEASSRLALLKARYTTLQYENAVYKAMGGRFMPASLAVAR